MDKAQKRFGIADRAEKAMRMVIDGCRELKACQEESVQAGAFVDSDFGPESHLRHLDGYLAGLGIQTGAGFSDTLDNPISVGGPTFRAILLQYLR